MCASPSPQKPMHNIQITLFYWTFVNDQNKHIDNFHD